MQETYEQYVENLKKLNPSMEPVCERAFRALSAPVPQRENFADVAQLAEQLIRNQ